MNNLLLMENPKENINDQGHPDSKNSIAPFNIEISSKINNEDIQKNKEKEKLKKIFYIKIFISAIYFILIICIEKLYRASLFSKSITIQEDIRKDHEKDSAFYNFWKFMSIFGEAKATFPIFGLIFVFFPLSSSFLTLQTLIYSIYITNLFKIIYRNGRPYWESELLDVVCNSGYGNPSGHSMTSTAYYLTLPHIVTNFQFFKSGKKNLILRIIIFCLFIIFGSLIMVSRVMLAAHAINQVIYGFSLGFGIYLVNIYLLSYHTYSSEKFLEHIINKFVSIFYILFHIILLIILIVVYVVIEDDKDIEYKSYNYIFNGIRCKIKNKYLMLKNDGFFQALSLTSLLGAHLGIIVLIFTLKKLNYIINGFIIEFNKSSIKKWLIRLPILLLSGIFIILYFCIPGDISLAVIFIFKSALPFFLTTFGIYFLGIFICIHYNLSNENIKLI